MTSSEQSRPLIVLLAGRWTLPVHTQFAGGRRYQDLDDAPDGVSHKVLSDKLRPAPGMGWRLRGRGDTR